MPSIGTLNKRHVSATAFLDQRDINPNLIDVANDSGFTKTMKLFGRTKKAKMYNYRHFVNTDMYVVAVASATITGSGTATVVVELTSGSGFFRQYDTVKFPNDKEGIITLVATSAGVDTLTIKSADATNLTLASTNTLTYSGNAVGESSTGVKNRKYDVTSYFNLIQIFREYDEITDVQKASKVEVTFNGSNYFSYMQMVKKAQAFQASIDIAMVAGVRSVTQFSDTTPALTDADGNPIQKTMGLDQYATTYGISDSITTTKVVLLADIDDMADQLNAVKAGTEFMGISGDPVKRAYDKMLKNLGSSDVTSGRISLDGKEVDFTADGFKYGTRKYEFVPMPLFDHPKLLTASIKGSMYWIPKDKVNVEGGGSEPRIQIRYMDHGISGGNELVGEWNTGALAPTPNGDKAVMGTHWISHQGLECLGAQHFVKQKVIF